MLNDRHRVHALTLICAGQSRRHPKGGPWTWFPLPSELFGRKQRRLKSKPAQTIQQGEILMRIGTLSRVARVVLGVILLGTCVTTSALATIDEFDFFATTGDALTLENRKTAQGVCDDCATGGLSIGFTFKFDGTNYTTFGVSTNGLVALGGTPTTSYSNSMPVTGVYLAPLWDDLYPLSSIDYSTQGSPGQRVLVIDWNVRAYASTSWTIKFQTRLYEGSNKIEFWYGAQANGSSFSSSIGLSKASNNYGTVDVSDQAFEFTTANNNEPAPTSSTLYVFDNCRTTITGNVAQGGSQFMDQGDTLLQNVVIERGNNTSRMPFTLVSNAGCIGGPATYYVTGPAAADYTFTPSQETVFPSTPTVTFNPQGTGVRRATLTIFGGSLFSYSYNLAARATPRLQLVPDLAQGGAAPMDNGAPLLENVSVPRLGTATRIPFSIRHIGTTGPAFVSYSLANKSGGQYVIDSPLNTSLNPGETTSLQISFYPQGIGVIDDTLIVNADGDDLRFPLRAFSEGTGGHFSINGTTLDTNSLLFVNEYGCVGEQFITLPMLVTNIGSLPFRIEGVDGYVTDTTYRQGTPRYPLRRDQFGNLIPAGDYIVTTTPPTSGGSFATYPIVIPVGQAQTLYLTFTPTRPGKRFARVYIRTNDEIRSAPDTIGALAQGLVVFDAFGRGSGSQLSDNPDGGLPQSLIFDKTSLGTSQDKWLMIENAGNCPLRIDEGALRINSGDVEEFAVLAVSSTWPRDVGNELLLPAGVRDSIQVRFTPRHVGSRRATLYMATNDSTVITRGLTERGVYYMDLYGEGKDGLYAGDANFPATEVTTASQPQTVTLRNAADAPFIIQSATIVGVDAGDFAEDGANPWPGRPFAVIPGQIMELSIVFTPSGSTAGPRMAQLELVTDRDDTLRALLTGEAGTKTPTGPASLNFGSLGIGGETRQTFAITNNGTMPARLTPPVITGVNATEFEVSPLSRLVLGAAETEMVEVTWRPAVVGASNATLTIGAEGGDIVVTLSGNGVRARYVGDDPTGSIGSNDGGGVVPPGAQGPTTGSSSVDRETRADGVSLWQSVPNPARDRTEILYTLERAGNVELSIYDGTGRRVAAVERGVRAAGEHRVAVDLGTLPAGAYHYTLRVSGVTLTRSLTIVR